MSSGHFPARRAFVAASGLGVVSLYLLWAGYGAAPLGVGGEHLEKAEHGGGHGGHAARASGATADEFRRLTQAFFERYRLADGSVQPRRSAPAQPIEVYLAALKWGYLPAVLRLEAGAPYRFRMMALDVPHGASLQLGAGARMIRLRPGALVEQELTFTRPGEYLVYCTVCCGRPHERMQGKIIATPPAART